MKLPIAPVLALFLAASAMLADERTVFETRFDSTGTGAYSLEGNASVFDFGKPEFETAGKCIALNSAPDANGGDSPSGAVKCIAGGLKGSEGKWFCFSFQGLPAKDFRIGPTGSLEMRVRFLGKGGKESLDGVVKQLYSGIQADRRDIDVNGDLFRYGSSVWTTSAFDFLLPFNDIDTVELSVSFKDGEGKKPYSSFFVGDLKLERIDPPAGFSAPAAVKQTVTGTDGLVSLGGRWYYARRADEQGAATPAHFDSSNFDRLIWKAGKVLEAPFSGNHGVWLRKGYKDEKGLVLQSDQWLANAVEADFTSDALVIHSHNVPNHPTGTYPGYLGNPGYIQVQDLTVYLPLNPQPNPNAIAMNKNDGNRALQMGPIGIAINGVVFYNPFDAMMQEAVSIMDRCCGHPDPSNLYHYHKYPVCARSPFEDPGTAHSRIIGWAFDGFPIYGPYEDKDEMAMDSRTNPLNKFNIHYDPDRGWHYHVTPGRFPYIIGGYWGTPDSRDFQVRRPPPWQTGLSGR